MTSQQFETLKRWIATRTAIAIEVSTRVYDKDFVEAKERELAAADDAAQSVLVVPQVNEL
jgi:hypothetical protein